MGVQDEMTHTFTVWSRDSGARTWSLVWSDLIGSVRELNPEGSRRESRGADSEPSATHVIRMTEEATDYVTKGCRLVDETDDDRQEYVVHEARWRDTPPPGCLKVAAAPVPAGTV